MLNQQHRSIAMSGLILKYTNRRNKIKIIRRMYNVNQDKSNRRIYTPHFMYMHQTLLQCNNTFSHMCTKHYHKKIAHGIITDTKEFNINKPAWINWRYNYYLQSRVIFPFCFTSPLFQSHSRSGHISQRSLRSEPSGIDGVDNVHNAHPAGHMIAALHVVWYGIVGFNVPLDTV